jgi:hypothetical protein
MSMFIRLRVVALSALLALSPVLPIAADPPQAVNSREAAADALFAQVEARPAATGTELDLRALGTAFGDFGRLTWTALGTDAATGAAVLSGVKFELSGDEATNLFTADEVLIWNMDFAALADRQNGRRLGDAIRLFDRIELVGLKMDLTDYSNSVDDAITGALPAAAANPVTFEKSEMTVGRMIVGGLTLHPWTFREIEGQEEGLAAVRLLSAIARGFSLENLALIDSDAVQTVIESGAPATFDIDYRRQLIQGYNRGDIASMVQTGVSFDGRMTVPRSADAVLIPASAGPPEQIEMSGAMGYSSWSGLRFSKLLEYGERGEFPPITERDLWSLGKYLITDTEMSFGGKPVFEIGRLEFSADRFAWFLPERLSVRHDDASFNLSNLMAFAATVEPETPPAAGEPTFAEIVGVLDRTGFGKLSGDGEFTLSWDSQTGETLLEGRGVADGLYGDETRFALRLPSYDKLVPAFGKDGKTPNDAALTELFEHDLAFSGGHYSLTDSGLLNAVALLTIEIAKLSGETDPMLAGFASSTPEGMRSFLSGAVMLGGGAVASEVPAANGWMMGLSRFITDGGTFTVRLAPDRALTAADFAAFEAGGAPDPAAIVGRLGLTMVHTPAEAPAVPR